MAAKPAMLIATVYISLGTFIIKPSQMSTNLQIDYVQSVVQSVCMIIIIYWLEARWVMVMDIDRYRELNIYFIYLFCVIQ